MSLNKIIKKIHTYVGLQAVLALLLFSITVIAVSIKSEEEPELSYHQFKSDISLEDIELAKLLYKEVGLRFEAMPKKWMLSEKEKGYLVIKLKSPAAKRELTINKISGNVEIKSWPPTFSNFANYMHQESFGRRKATDSMWLWAWSLYIELSILALFVLPATGLYIWASKKTSKKFWANFSLFCSLMTMSLLWNLLR